MAVKKDEITWRVGVIYVMMLLLAVMIFVKIIMIQFVQGNEYKSKAEQLTLKDITIEANRGDIYAADGRLLSTSIPYYEIRMDTRSTGMEPGVFATKVDSLAICLSSLFRDKSALDYKNELIAARRRGERFYLIKRRVNYNELKKLKQFPLFRLGQFKGGFIVLQNNTRIQPHVDLASRTIGRTTKSEEGNVVGIEGAYDNELRGVEGVRLMQKISGNVWMPVNDGNEVNPKDGKDVVTTIDVDIQDVAENALRKQLKKHEAHHGTAVLMEVSTGEIKAIANLERISDGSYKETYNYAVGESTEPGSTFKLASLIAMLEDGYVSLDDTVDTGEGVFEIEDHKLYDSKKGGHGVLSVKEVFEVSSNVGVASLTNRYYKGREEKFLNRLYQLNLNKKLSLEIRGEGTPDIKYKGDKLWSGLSLTMMSIGYEVRLTPLQTLTLYNAVANDGEMVKPKFVKSLKYHGEEVERFDTEVINPMICSRNTLKKVHEVLEGVVENGTAKNLKNNNYKIAGKTGTAQIADKKYGYRNKSEINYQASFVGYFPADNPKYSCIVVVNSPSQNVYYGNLVAGPVFKEIADKVYATSFEMHDNLDKVYADTENKIPYTKHSHREELASVLKEMNLPYEEQEVYSPWVLTTQTDSAIVLNNRKVQSNLMPNVVGMGIKDALFILENMQLSVSFSGRGTVLEQSLAPGTRIYKGEKVDLTMSITN